MYTSGEYERINEELNNLLKSKRDKIKKVWMILLIITVFICGLFIVIFPMQFSNGEVAWILPTYGGMAFVTTLIGYIVSIKYRSEKPYFNYLYEEILHKINLNEGLFMEYEAYEKADKEFNVSGGLFTRMASIKVRRHIKGKSEQQNDFDVLDCTMTTSNGKSQTVHFDGVYFIVHKHLNTSLQVRSNGSPKLKGVKYNQFKEIEDIKVYKPQEQSLSNIDHMFVKFIKKLEESENVKRVYLSIVDNALHVAISYKKHPLRKPKTFDLNVLNQLANSLFDEIKFINELEKIDHFDY